MWTYRTRGAWFLTLDRRGPTLAAVRFTDLEEYDMRLRLVLVLAMALGAAGNGMLQPVADAARGSASSSTAAVTKPVAAVIAPAAAASDPGTTVDAAPLVVATLAQAQQAGETPDATEPTDAATDGAAATDDPGTDGESPATTPEPTPSTTPPSDEQAPVDPTSTTVVADELSTDGRVLTPPVDTADVQTLGVTWPEGVDTTALEPQVRSRDDGTWSDWVELEGSEGAPDEGTVEAARETRGGTESVWIGDADAVQLSFAATTAGGPDDLQLALIGSDPVTPAAPATSTAPASSSVEGPSAVVRTAAYVTSTASSSVTSAEPAAVATAVSAPAVYSRASWGARAQACAPDVASSLVGAVVHHTAGSNSYTTVAAAMQQIRNDQAYHIDGRGWCDIGYNFIVDKWGNIYEGRANSMTAPVIGVHAGGFNTGTVGVAMLGSYDAAPSAATQQAVGQIIGWRLGAYGVDPQGWMSYYTGVGENSRYQNQYVSLPRVFGHRDVAFTACPGNGGYAALPTIRAVAASVAGAMAVGEAQSVVTALYQDLLGRGPDPTGLTGWTAALVSGVSQANLVTALTHSDEYISLRITQAYREVLGREPDPQGAQEWLVAIRAGYATVDDVQRRFYDSSEYVTISGGTERGYIARLYDTMLRRGASQSEIDSWLSVWQQSGRTVMVDAIWFSFEAASIRAGDYYQVFLGRGPDPSGQAAWAQVLLGYGEGAVRAGIAGSLEYRARAIARFPS